MKSRRYDWERYDEQLLGGFQTPREPAEIEGGCGTDVLEMDGLRSSNDRSRIPMAMEAALRRRKRWNNMRLIAAAAVSGESEAVHNWIIR